MKIALLMKLSRLIKRILIFRQLTQKTKNAWKPKKTQKKFVLIEFYITFPNNNKSTTL